MLYEGADLVAFHRRRLRSYQCGAVLELMVKRGFLGIFRRQAEDNSQGQTMVQAARGILVHAGRWMIPTADHQNWPKRSEVDLLLEPVRSRGYHWQLLAGETGSHCQWKLSPDPDPPRQARKSTRYLGIVVAAVNSQGKPAGIGGGI